MSVSLMEAVKQSSLAFVVSNYIGGGEREREREREKVNTVAGCGSTKPITTADVQRLHHSLVLITTTIPRPLSKPKNKSTETHPFS